MSAETVDPVFTGWAKEWWPEAEVYWIQEPDESERWFIRNALKETIELDSGGRLSARLALHLLIESELARGNAGPDVHERRQR